MKRQVRYLFLEIWFFMKLFFHVEKKKTGGQHSSWLTLDNPTGVVPWIPAHVPQDTRTVAVEECSEGTEIEHEFAE